MLVDPEESLSSLSNAPEWQKDKENDSGGTGEDSTSELSEGGVSAGVGAKEEAEEEQEPQRCETMCTPLKEY